MESNFLELARRFMPLPTAPFNESFVADEIATWTAERPRLHTRRDRFGNLLLTYNGTPETQRAVQPALILTAHMDHPALGYLKRLSPRRHLFEVLGGLPRHHLHGARVRLYNPDAGPGQQATEGRITQVQTPEKGRSRTVVTLRRSMDLPRGAFAVLDLAPWVRRGRKLHAAVCDDLAGMCCALAFIDNLQRDAQPVHVGVLLTRAEEVGFGGMLAAVRHGFLPPQALYINIECSSAAAGAPLGAGPVLRVGDRLTLFDPSINAGLAALAENLVQTDSGFSYQRKLMDGGACEATVLSQEGFTVGAVALPLANYHNNGPRGVAPEAIHLDDALSLVKLLVEAAVSPGGLAQLGSQAAQSLDKHLEGRYQALVPRLLA